jgi:protein-S-isoprenylcysteine O-methyltransferase Ste14
MNNTQTMNRAFLYSLIALTRIFSDLPLFGMFYFLYFQKTGVGGASDVAMNAFLFILFGALHSLLARSSLKQQVAGWIGDRYVRTFYVIFSGVALVLLMVLWRPVTGILWRTDGFLSWILTILYLGCVMGMIYTSSFIDYLDFLGIRTLLRTIRNRPPKPPIFSASGPYAYCRHPMYLFLFMAFWIGPVMTFSRLEFAMLGSIYLIIGTLFEEKNLRQELGEVYDVYQANVPMWIPRLRPWQGDAVNSMKKG